MKNNIVIIVNEDHNKNGVEWGICLGQPNPTEEFYFSVESKEKAFEIKKKLDDYLKGQL